MGKRIWVNGEGKEIPILAGREYIGSVGKAKFGVLSAYTDKVENDLQTCYFNSRIKFAVLENSEVGVLYSKAKNDVEMREF